jgi:hypothetical protein
MVHRSVVREVVLNTLTNYTDASDPDLEDELVDALCDVFDIVVDDEKEGLEIPED